MSTCKIFAILICVTVASAVLVEQLPLKAYGKATPGEITLPEPTATDFASSNVGDFWSVIGQADESIMKSDPATLIAELKHGNERFTTGATRTPPASLGEESNSRVAVVSCADCPLSSEVVFDMPANKLFQISNP